MASGIMEISLWFLKMKWSFNTSVIEFSPLDFIFKVDPEYPARNCEGMTYQERGLLLSLHLDWFVNECWLGFLAYTWEGFNPYTCFWR